MSTISRQLQLPYSTTQMYALVNDVASYPQFVPWCTQATIYSADHTHMRARLQVEWQGVQQGFTTENKLVENQSISMNLIEGPIKNLQGDWRFVPTSSGSHVELTLSFTFNNRLLSLLFAKVVDKILNRLVDAFCQRAKVLYG
ncbi:MAG TPA: type II toxin-antitoxin system RatA family toxin [Gammaproteobacteria bacterium]|nr:type II toxin-antitoxin system RatA family toxin [Gammaproteobacteria bacterium]